MEANNWLLHPDVPRMVRLAVKRKLRMFDEYHDLDADSLYADVIGKLVEAKYDPTKSKPGTFAYQVAWRRLMDISRRRTKEAEKQAEGREVGEVRRGAVEADRPLEEIAAEIYEAAKVQFKRENLPIRPKHCGKPYLDQAQRVAIHLFRERMGWNCDDAPEAFSAHPDVLAAIGVTQTPSSRFFYRTKRRVTQLTKFFSRRPASSLPA